MATDRRPNVFEKKKALALIMGCNEATERSVASSQGQDQHRMYARPPGANASKYVCISSVLSPSKRIPPATATTAPNEFELAKTECFPKKEGSRPDHGRRSYRTVGSFVARSGPAPNVRAAPSANASKYVCISSVLGPSKRIPLRHSHNSTK